MGVAEIEYTWVYPANWHFSGEPWRIRWLQIPYLQAKPRRELHFFPFASGQSEPHRFNAEGLTLPLKPGSKARTHPRNVQFEIANDATWVFRPQKWVFHIYIYIFFIAIIDRSPCHCWTSPQNKMCNMLPKQRMLETCIKCFKLQTAPQHTLFSSHAAPILMEQMPWQNQAEFGKYDEQST